VVWIGDLPRDPGDITVLSMAASDRRILVTLDRDFGELAVHQGRPHCGIIRIVDIRVAEQCDLILAILSEHQPALIRGAIVTASAGRIRVRAPDTQT
jgi:predicted nuclease of predicted toxin-antitoxin system